MNTFKYKKVPHHCSVVNVLDIACLAANKDYILQRMECKYSYILNEKLKCVFSNKIVYVAYAFVLRTTVGNCTEKK